MKSIKSYIIIVFLLGAHATSVNSHCIIKMGINRNNVTGMFFNKLLGGHPNRPLALYTKFKTNRYDQSPGHRGELIGPIVTYHSATGETASQNGQYLLDLRNCPPVCFFTKL